MRARRKFDQIGASNYGCKPKVQTKVKGTSIVIDGENVLYILRYCMIFVVHSVNHACARSNA